MVDEGVMNATLEKAMGRMGGEASELKAQMAAAKRAAGFTTSKNLNAVADAQQRAKMQIAAAFIKNQEMMVGLTRSFDVKLSESEAESVALLKSLGLAGLSQEDMKGAPCASMPFTNRGLSRYPCRGVRPCQ